METFGQRIRQARKSRRLSQRELAKRVGLDFTYLSKLENDRANYPPKEDAIRKLAESLGLDAEELVFLAGRIPSENEEVLKRHYQEMPALFRRMQDPYFARKVFSLSDDQSSNSRKNIDQLNIEFPDEEEDSE